MFVFLDKYTLKKKRISTSTYEHDTTESRLFEQLGTGENCSVYPIKFMNKIWCLGSHKFLFINNNSVYPCSV